MVRLTSRLLLPVLIAGAGAVWAQQEEQAEQEQTESAQQQPAEAQEIEAGDAAAEIGEVEGDGEFERFIPTEQVSRDLGVSFPADI